MSISKQDLIDIGKVVGNVVGNLMAQVKVPPVAPAPAVSNEPQTIVTDPLVTAADDKLADIIATAPMGNIIVKGRRGAQMINQSEESANMITDIIKNKKHRYTRNNLY